MSPKYTGCASVPEIGRAKIFFGFGGALSLVLLGFLLDIANLLSNLLQRVLVSAVLRLEVCGMSQKPVSQCVSGRLSPCCLLAGAA